MYSHVLVRVLPQQYSQRACRLGARYYSKVAATSSSKQQNASRKRLRKCALAGTVCASWLGFWLWSANNSRQAALRPLSPDYFSPMSLVSSDKTSETARFLRLNALPEVALGTSTAQPIWSIYVKDSDIQVERPYTPLEGISPEGDMIFWIKKYEHGEVGRWLHSRKVGEKIEIRGLEQTWPWHDNVWDNVIMIAGGTGIAPFFQLLHSCFSKSTPNTKTKFTLLHSYRSPKELPPPQILESISSWEKGHPNQLKVHTFVDTLEGESPQGKLIEGRISHNALKTVLKASSGKTIVLICGPDPMINALAGPKGRDQSQGPIAGTLGSLSDGTFDVWKL